MKTIQKTTLLCAGFIGVNVFTAHAHHHTQFHSEEAHTLSHLAIGLVVVVLAFGAYLLSTRHDAVKSFFKSCFKK
ncbi:MAG: hypothetical protein LBU90_02450 [Bacteroidales bacterium]|jgi:hypothetical protein|nr:hypothetical protein [Bacteroidales bacterium]